MVKPRRATPITRGSAVRSTFTGAFGGTSVQQASQCSDRRCVRSRRAGGGGSRSSSRWLRSLPGRFIASTSKAINRIQMAVSSQRSIRGHFRDRRCAVPSDRSHAEHDTTAGRAPAHASVSCRTTAVRSGSRPSTCSRRSTRTVARPTCIRYDVASSVVTPVTGGLDNNWAYTVTDVSTDGTILALDGLSNWLTEQGVFRFDTVSGNLTRVDLSLPWGPVTVMHQAIRSSMSGDGRRIAYLADPVFGVPACLHVFVWDHVTSTNQTRRRHRVGRAQHGVHVRSGDFPRGPPCRVHGERVLHSVSAGSRPRAREQRNLDRRAKPDTTCRSRPTASGPHS